MSPMALGSIPSDADAFKRVFPLLAADYAQLKSQLRISSLESLRQLSNILDDNPATRRERDRICHMRLQTSSTANALLDVDCTKQLQKALAAVTYKSGFELVNFDDNKAPIRLCICCQAFVQHPVFETWTSGDLGGLVRTRSAKNHHETLFQLIACCYNSRPGCRLCQVLWRSFGMSRRQPGHRYYRYGEPFKLCIMRLENSSNISLASDMVQFVDRFRPKVCPMIRVRLLRKVHPELIPA